MKDYLSPSARRAACGRRLLVGWALCALLLSACAGPTPDAPVGQATALPAAPAITLPPEQMPTAEPLWTVAPSQPDPVAIVAGRAISWTEYQAALVQAQSYAANRPQGASNAADPADLPQQVLDWLIDRVLVEQAAQQFGVMPTETAVEAELTRQRGDDPARFAQWLAANGLTEAALRVELRAQLTALAVQQHLTAKLPRQAEQVHVAHILAGDRATADDLARTLAAGGDFATLAKEQSEDTATRAQGGDLGWLPHGIMPPTLDQAAFALTIGQVSAPVQSDMGWHLVRLVEGPAPRPVADALWPAVQQAAFADWLALTRTHAQIERRLP